MACVILKIRKGDPYESGKRTPPPQGHALLSFPTKAAPGQAAGKGPGLYTASTLYHCRNVSVKGRIALRKYDHASIYFLIAGTYTPICLVVLRTDGAWGWALFGVIWALALAGLVLTLAWITAPRWLTAGIYIFMGWLAVVALVPLLRLLPPAGFFWVLGGGILYTVGGVLYAVKWPGRDNPRFGCHEIFHLFILMGSVFHFMLMYRVVAFL